MSIVLTAAAILAASAVLALPPVHKRIVLPILMSWRYMFAELPLRLFTGRWHPDGAKIEQFETELGWRKPPLEYMVAGHVHDTAIRFGCSCIYGTAEVHRSAYAGTDHNCVACDYMSRHPEAVSQHGHVAGLWTDDLRTAIGDAQTAIDQERHARAAFDQELRDADRKLDVLKRRLAAVEHPQPSSLEAGTPSAVMHDSAGLPVYGTDAEHRPIMFTERGAIPLYSDDSRTPRGYAKG